MFRDLYRCYLAASFVGPMRRSWRGLSVLCRDGKAGERPRTVGQAASEGGAEKPAKLQEEGRQGGQGQEEAPSGELSRRRQGCSQETRRKEKAKAKAAAAEKAREGQEARDARQGQGRCRARREAETPSRSNGKPVESGLPPSRSRPMRPHHRGRRDKPVDRLDRRTRRRAAGCGCRRRCGRSPGQQWRTAQRAGESRPSGGFFEVLFGDEQTTTAGDAAGNPRARRRLLEQARRSSSLKPEYEPQVV